MSEIGHNSIAGEALRQYAERIERLNEEKASLQEDINGVFAEARATGYDVKILRKIIALRKVSEADYKETQELLSTYAHALGMSIFD